MAPLGVSKLGAEMPLSKARARRPTCTLTFPRPWAGRFPIVTLWPDFHRKRDGARCALRAR